MACYSSPRAAAVTGSGMGLIAVEGLDGSGKTTLANAIAGQLEDCGVDVLLLSLPWREGTAGAYIDSVVRAQTESCPPAALALAFAANRSHLSEQVIEPWLARESPTAVVVDRHMGSGLAYQMLDGLSPDWLLSINSFVRMPDTVLFVDTPVAVCRTRIRRRGKPLELFENRLEPAQRSFELALNLLQGTGSHVVRLDGRLSEADLADHARDSLGLHSKEVEAMSTLNGDVPC